jgi:hypothetical protein
MKTVTSMAGSLGVLLLVLAVLGLGISTVSAAAGTSSSGNMTALHGQGSGHHFAQNSTRQHTLQGSNITQFHSRGANVNASAAAFWKNTTAAGAWFAAHPGAKGGNITHEKNGQGFAVNATMQQAHLQSFIAELQKQGVDVSTVQTALQNNDTAAVNSWLKSYFETHKEALINSTRQQWHPRNTTVSRSA